MMGTLKSNKRRTNKLNMLFVFFLLQLAGCTSQQDEPVQATLTYNDVRGYPVQITGIKKCTSTSKYTLNINNNAPLTIIVHGCFSSAGKFRALADVYNLHGQQAVCFEYDDREDLDVTSGQLISAVNKITQLNPEQKLHIIGHSQGGLVARRALISNRDDKQKVHVKNIHLTTISTPFNGITASSHCGLTSLRFLSAGFVDLICYTITGYKYKQIPPNSSFILNPGKLIPEVSKHLIIKTDERDSCRQFNKNNQCLKDDYVFSLDEQAQPLSALNSAIDEVTIKAGHVEIVGNEQVAPIKLINILKAHQLLRDKNELQPNDLMSKIKQIYLNYNNLI